ncbi:hypothetical protein OPV22_014747 [Ensete ventricosum]|uniref:Uncharacterized protein n=1 Tax=Ensete ventricosum TaxID=4639 RepID=A0AAV8R6R3_ENSVE|nr:hypothetical protein OPV22_014747 [Ensete ventricosum]
MRPKSAQTLSGPLSFGLIKPVSRKLSRELCRGRKQIVRVYPGFPPFPHPPSTLRSLPPPAVVSPRPPQIRRDPASRRRSASVSQPRLSRRHSRARSLTLTWFLDFEEEEATVCRFARRTPSPPRPPPGAGPR